MQRLWSRFWCIEETKWRRAKAERLQKKKDAEEELPKPEEDKQEVEEVIAGHGAYDDEIRNTLDLRYDAAVTALRCELEDALARLSGPQRMRRGRRPKNSNSSSSQWRSSSTSSGDTTTPPLRV